MGVKYIFNLTVLFIKKFAEPTGCQLSPSFCSAFWPVTLYTCSGSDHGVRMRVERVCMRVVVGGMSGFDILGLN